VTMRAITFGEAWALLTRHLEREEERASARSRDVGDAAWTEARVYTAVRTYMRGVIPEPGEER